MPINRCAAPLRRAMSRNHFHRRNIICNTRVTRNCRPIDQSKNRRFLRGRILKGRNRWTEIFLCFFQHVFFSKSQHSSFVRRKKILGRRLHARWRIDSWKMLRIKSLRRNRKILSVIYLGINFFKTRISPNFTWNSTFLFQTISLKEYKQCKRTDQPH